MRHRDQYQLKDKEHHPQVGIGIFLIVLGITLLIATNDLLNLGSLSRYFWWDTGMVFIGIVLLLNLNFTGGLLLIAGGTWFLLDEFFIVVPDIIKTIYWPAVIVLIGLSFILSSFFKKKFK